MQGSTIDIVTAYEKIQLILQEMKAIRSNAEVEFQNVFETATELAEKAGQNITMPRCCKKQTMRSNVEADTPQTYYRRTIFVPFLENMVQQMADRFPQLTLHATRGLFLIPNNLEGLTNEHVKGLLCYYGPDLPAETFVQEVRLWKRQWNDSHGEDEPAKLKATLQHKFCNPRMFPNIHRIL